MFFEDVELWLNSHEVRFLERIKLSGKSGFDYMFEFIIPKSKTHPERIIKTINDPTRNAARNLLFAWFDTKEGRETESKAYAILNDSGREVTPTVIEAFKKYEIEPVLWSKREEVVEELVA